MGSKIAPGFGRQATRSAFYGNGNAPMLPTRSQGQRTMPGGPLLPRLPQNPFAATARRIARLSSPQVPRILNRQF
jgi:hypothetical protein